jgi:hypothetical protein
VTLPAGHQTGPLVDTAHSRRKRAQLGSPIGAADP